MKKIISLFTLVLVFTSCEDVVQIKLDEGSKLYVIDAFINDLRENQIVKVITNDSYFSNREAPPVTNAQVVLLDLTDNKTYNFAYTEKGNYVFNLTAADTIAKTGHVYKLSVKIDGFEYTSQTMQKRTAGIDSIGVFFNDGSGGSFGPPKDTYNCFLFAKDKVDANTDYYWVRTFRNDTLFNDPGDISLSIDGTNGAVTSSPADSALFTPPVTFLGFKTYRKFDKCRVQIHSISRETYFFFEQASTQINNGGLFATTPENVKSNINTPSDAKTKAVGWFNMASVFQKERIVQ
jgi:hypothetical protein